MPIPWKCRAFSEQAESILDMFEGLTEEERSLIYDEWEKNQYLDHPMGRIEALNDLQIMAQRVYLEKCGKGNIYEKLHSEWLAQQG